MKDVRKTDTEQLHPFEVSLDAALKRTAPNDVTSVLSRLHEQKGCVTPMKKTNLKRILPAIAACLALVLLAGTVFAYQASNAITTVVSVDVNPAIELRVNAKEVVRACIPLNADAEAVLAEMNGGKYLKGTKLTVAMNAIVGALLQNGYLDRLSETILISVEDKDITRAATLEAELSKVVDAYLRQKESAATVLSQNVSENQAAKDLAAEYNISVGKAAYVEMVISLQAELAEKKSVLAALSVEELSSLAQSGAAQLPIGKDAAKEAALAAAKLAYPDAANLKVTDVDAELDDYPPHYEIELFNGKSEFEYHIDAFTGEILFLRSSFNNVKKNTDTAAYLTADEAIAAALAHAQLNRASVHTLHAWIDFDDGKPEHYNIEFEYGNKHYEYDIALTEPTVLDVDIDIYQNGTVTPDVGAVTAALDKKAASYIAIADAVAYLGTQGTWRVTEVDAELDENPPHYDIELFHATYGEAEYKVDAQSGAIIERKLPQTPASSDTTDVGKDAALLVALAHANTTENAVSRLKIERDYDDGTVCYEIEFVLNGMTYEYEISANGTILSSEKEPIEYDD